MVATVVWGTGNVGRAAILGHALGVAATDDVEAVLTTSPRAVTYAASGDVRFA